MTQIHVLLVMLAVRIIAPSYMPILSSSFLTGSKQEEKVGEGIRSQEGPPTSDLNQNLVTAALNGDTNRVKALIASGAEVNAYVVYSTQTEVLEVTSLGMKADEEFPGGTPLMAAAWGGHILTVIELLAAGADVNAKGDGVTVMAIRAGSMAFFQKLRVSSALEAAVLKEHTSIVKELLASGADVNAKSGREWTSLMTAALIGNSAIVQALVAKGAVNAKTEDGGPALMIAVVGGHTEIVQILLTNGADVNERLGDGTSLLTAAKKLKYKEIEKLLKKAGAKK